MSAPLSHGGGFKIILNNLRNLPFTKTISKVSQFQKVFHINVIIIPFKNKTMKVPGNKKVMKGEKTNALRKA